MGCSASSGHCPYSVPFIVGRPEMENPQSRNGMNKKSSTTSYGEPVALTETQKKKVRDTWYRLRAQLTQIGIDVFKEILHLEPQAKQLFAFRNKANEELRNDPQFRGHAARFMQAVGAVLDRLDSTDGELQMTLLDLGKEHNNFNSFDPKYFTLFTTALLNVLEKYVGRDKFTEEVKDSWKRVIKFMITEMKTGYDHVRRQKESGLGSQQLQGVKEEAHEHLEVHNGH